MDDKPCILHRIRFSSVQFAKEANFDLSTEDASFDMSVVCAPEETIDVFDVQWKGANLTFKSHNGAAVAFACNLARHLGATLYYSFCDSSYPGDCAEAVFDGFGKLRVAPGLDLNTQDPVEKLLWPREHISNAMTFIQMGVLPEDELLISKHEGPGTRRHDFKLAHHEDGTPLSEIDRIGYDPIPTPIFTIEHNFRTYVKRFMPDYQERNAELRERQKKRKKVQGSKTTKQAGSTPSKPKEKGIESLPKSDRKGARARAESECIKTLRDNPELDATEVAKQIYKVYGVPLFHLLDALVIEARGAAAEPVEVKTTSQEKQQEQHPHQTASTQPAETSRPEKQTSGHSNIPQSDFELPRKSPAGMWLLKQLEFNPDATGPLATRQQCANLKSLLEEYLKEPMCATLACALDAHILTEEEHQLILQDVELIAPEFPELDPTYDHTVNWTSSYPAYVIGKDHDGTYAIWTPASDTVRHGIRFEYSDAWKGVDEIPEFGKPIFYSTLVVDPTYAKFWVYAKNHRNGSWLLEPLAGYSGQPLLPDVPTTPVELERIRDAHKVELSHFWMNAAETLEPAGPEDIVCNYSKGMALGGIDPKSWALNRLLDAYALSRSELEQLNIDVVNLLETDDCAKIAQPLFMVCTLPFMVRDINDNGTLVLLDFESNSFITVRPHPELMEDSKFQMPQIGQLVNMSVAIVDPAVAIDLKVVNGSEQ